MNHAPRPSRAFTLVELTVTVVVMAIAGAMLIPVIHGAADAYGSSVATRQTCDRVAYAMERTLRLLRDVPLGSSDASVAITTAAADRVVFSDGRALELDSGTLVLTDSGVEAPLCRNVDAFEITYLAEDGVTSTLSTPAATQRFFVTLRSGGFELRGSAFARVRVGGGS
ncbi:MAG: prepilin-type N-terminal cleavage/methylation domain-containing protein [Phycisphaerae bacterium]|nr:prepilin-type N-terminal cleavage/methylation domain-containing protein [Phycisphaerae bacterium]